MNFNKNKFTCGVSGTSGIESLNIRPEYNVLKKIVTIFTVRSS